MYVYVCAYSNLHPDPNTTQSLLIKGKSNTDVCACVFCVYGKITAAKTVIVDGRGFRMYAKNLCITNSRFGKIGASKQQMCTVQIHKTVSGCMRKIDRQTERETHRLACPTKSAI